MNDEKNFGGMLPTLVARQKSNEKGESDDQEHYLESNSTPARMKKEGPIVSFTTPVAINPSKLKLRVYFFVPIAFHSC